MRILWLSDFRSTQFSELTYHSLLWCRRLKEKNVEPVLCNIMPLDIRSHPIDIQSATFFRQSRRLIQTWFSSTELWEHTCTSSLQTLPVNIQYATMLFMQKVDYIIAPSEVMEHRLRSYGCMDIAVVPPSVDPSQYSPTECKDPTICILAKTSPVRNHLTLIEAISLVREEVPEVELAIVPWREMLGGNADLPQIYYEILQRLGLTSQVKFTGEIHPKDLFREVSILADPSFSSVSPSTVLQAYLHGVPCVLSYAGWSDMFTAPMKAFPDNPKGWAEKLITLLTDREEYETTRHYQRQEMMRKFDINKNIEKLIQVFEDLQQLQPYKVKRK